MSFTSVQWKSILLLFSIALCNAENITLSVNTLRYAADFTNETFDGTLVVAGSACKPITDPNLLQGKIALLLPNGCYPQLKIKHAQQAGAIAAVLVSYEKAFGLLSLYNIAEKIDITIPAWEISFETYETLLRQDEKQIPVTIQSDEPQNFINDNPQFFLGFRAYSLITAVFALGSFVFAVTKLTRIIMKTEIQLSLPQFALWMEAFAAIFRVAWLVDPFCFSQVLTWQAQSLLMWLTLPFTIITSLLVSVYWRELVHPTIADLRFNHSKWKYPCIAFSAILILAQIAVSTLSALFFDPVLLQSMVASFYILISIVSLIFFVYSGVDLIQFLREETIHGKALVSQIKKSLILHGICKVLLIGILATMLSPINSTPIGFLILNLALVFAMVSLSMVHINFFHSPKQVKKNQEKAPGA